MGMKKKIKMADVINMGSQFAYYDFNYDGLPIKAVNLAGLPQYFDYDLKYIKKYKNCFKNGTKILIVFGTFVLAANARERSKSIDHYYLTFYPWEITDFSFSKFIQTVLFAIPRKMRHIGGNCYRKLSLKIGTKNRRADYAEKINAAETRINGWMSVLDIPSMNDGIVPGKIEENIDVNIGYLNEMIVEIKSVLCEPYIIIPPVSEIMNSRISEECIHAYLLNPIEKRKDKSVPVMNYLWDERFQSEKYYKNADCLNSKSAKEFTKIVLKDIGILN